MDNRRASKRFGLRLPVTITRMGSGLTVAAETRDIGTEGFRCIVPEPFAIGERFQFVIALPDPAGAPVVDCGIAGEAEVVRIAADTSQAAFDLGCRIQQFRMVTEVPETVTVMTRLFDMGEAFGFMTL